MPRLLATLLVVALGSGPHDVGRVLQARDQKDRREMTGIRVPGEEYSCIFLQTWCFVAPNPGVLARIPRKVPAWL